MTDSNDGSVPGRPESAAEPTETRDVASTSAPGTADRGEALDLDAVERDLDDVETALGRLDDGTYWTDEVTGEEIPDHALADNPATRRA